MVTFYFALGKTYQKWLFLFSSEGIKSPKRSDHNRKHKSKPCIKYVKDQMSMKFHQKIQNQMWQSCTAIMYESICNFCLTANIIFYIHAESCISLECILQSPDVIFVPPSNWRPSSASKSHHYFLLGRKSMCLIQCHTSRQRKKLGSEKNSSPFLLSSRQHHLHLYAMAAPLLFWIVVAKKKTAQ